MQDSLSKIILVAGGVCLVCSVFVSAAVVGLKPFQERNALLYKQQNIIAAAGLSEAGKKPSAAEAERIFKDDIETVVVDLNTGEVLKDVDPNGVDPKKEAKDAKQSTDLGADDLAKIGNRPNRAVVYMTKKNGDIDRIVFPIYGKGLWSTMYGFISLNASDLSVESINFYEHGETPGLGGEIANPSWQAKWKGKHVYEKLGQSPKIRVTKNGGVQEEAYDVDGIAGSTLTSVGVSHTVQFWLGQHGFEKFIEKMKQH